MAPSLFRSGTDFGPEELALPVTSIPRRRRTVAMQLQIAMISLHLGGSKDLAGMMDGYLKVIDLTPDQWLRARPMTKVARHEHAMDRLFGSQGVDRATATSDQVIPALRRLIEPLGDMIGFTA